jgi:hypothetical protein
MFAGIAAADSVRIMYEIRQMPGTSPVCSIFERNAERMGDSGEGLVDANSRLEERMEEIQENRLMAKQQVPDLDPERIRAIESIRLAKIDLERQLANTAHEAQRLYLVNVLAELDRRIGDLQTAP